MPVDQNGGLARGVQPVGVHYRMPTGGQDLDVLCAGGLQAVSHPFGGLLHIRGILRQRRNAGNT